jgi:predicted nucleic acid-binding protein
MAARIIYVLRRWRTHVPAPSDILGATDIHIETNISFWDAMIVRSASQLGCTVIWSEDLTPGQAYRGVLVQNPFDA